MKLARGIETKTGMLFRFGGGEDSVPWRLRIPWPRTKSVLSTLATKHFCSTIWDTLKCDSVTCMSITIGKCSTVFWDNRTSKWSQCHKKEC